MANVEKYKLNMFLKKIPDDGIWSINLLAEKLSERLGCHKATANTKILKLLEQGYLNKQYTKTARNGNEFIYISKSDKKWKE